MNKRYIDFVPAKSSSARATRQVQRPTEARPRAAMVTRATVTKTVVTEMPARSVSNAHLGASRTVIKAAPQREIRKTPQRVPRVTEPAIHKMPVDKKPMLGVIEDLNSHFVEANVPKRPLSERPSVAPKATEAKVAEAKQKNVKARVLKPVAKSAKTTPVKPVEKSVENSTYKTPKSPFINQSKVVKRPLSGNVYKRQVVEAVKDEPKGPVTIITKPEKDRRIGIIVTIIITIILGAAAGTVAFLLLPK